MYEKIRMGVSTCLLGHSVRYDGGHKRDAYLVNTLGKWFEYVPVCPEVECGLPVPREAMRLEGEVDAPRLVTIRSSRDLTAQMCGWVKKRLRELAKENLAGFIFKSRSPSSGMERVKIYDRNGVPRNAARGLFAGPFQDRFPLLPVEEEGRLHDPKLRENFIERVFALKRWRDTLARGKSRGSLVAHHTREKYLIMAHSPKHYREMGKRVAAAKELGTRELFCQYETLLMEALRLKTTPKKHANVLQHMMGYFKKQLSPDEKAELLERIDQFKNGWVPLVVPLTLLSHYVRKYDQEYLAGQTYLSPHPVELQLRNHV